MSFNVFITRKIPEEGINLLKKFCQKMEVNPHDRPLTYDELMQESKDRDAMLTMLSDRMDARLIQEATNLKVIANYAVGYDNIDIKAASAK
ncbi:MAG: glyoxylate reductase, partial [Planctomycetota bacterium]|nr:glyoxylate reductase [Planctomycetota bacterium]